MADVTPIVPEGRQRIETYGGGRFTVTGTVYEHAILVTPERTVAWDVSGWDDVTLESLQPLTGGEDAPNILLLGGGEKLKFPSKELRQALRRAGIVVECMDTGAACRTFNVLMSEERPVAAALLPVG